MLDKINNNEIRISRITNLSESVMRDCYYVMAQSLPMDADKFFYNAIGDVNHRNHILFIAETPRMVVGVLKGFTYDIRAQIDCFCVDKKYRRRGIGNSLINAYEDYVCNECGAEYVGLKSSSGAVNFYRNRGYLGETQYLRKDFSR